ncbi:hypothetical protein [Amycolatopsis sp. CA-126428]|uniref:hypothetical protein n=1 Tax=Amycolatopsis sp. CA-126428 TaxID=2073158 RepID=UPI000CD28634|nr:hypothetical protein [Amycolatopsis sp. CA-126428]
MLLLPADQATMSAHGPAEDHGRQPWHMRLFCATALLLIGVGAVTAAASTDSWWWGAPGYACLSLVPALIFDAAVDEILRRCERR